MSGLTAIQHHDRYTEVWNDHDPDAVMATFADGGTVSDPATDGTLSGPEIGDWVEETVTAFPDVRFEVNRRVADDESVFVEWTMPGTHENAFGAVPATGRTVALDGVDVVSVSEDGIAAIDGYFDTAAFRAQLGLTFPAVVGQLPKLALGAARNAL